MSRHAAYGASLPAALAAFLLIAACTAAPGAAPTEPAAAPTPAPIATPSPTVAAAPTEQPTEAPAATPTGTPISQNPDDLYGGGGATAAPAGSDEATVSVSTSAEHGDYLVGPDGLALYIFTRDDPGVSNCTDSCLEAWPPLTVEMGETPSAGEGVTGTLGTIERDDGTLQVTYDDQPLYYFSADSAPGDTSGHEVGGVWFLATP